MPHEFEEHLLSAYLDNELSAEERALVEERLKTDAAARQLLDDLKRVRSLVATLPRWKGDDLTAALPDGQTPVNAVGQSGDEKTLAENVLDDKPADAAVPVTVHQVDFSATSLAESRLRRKDHTSTARTRRSMRWTSIVAVAAGLATLMLGAPYLFRSRAPMTEVAQHTDYGSPPAAIETSPAEAQPTTTATASEQAGEKSAKEPVDEYAEQNVALADSFFRQQIRDAEPPADEGRVANRGAAPSRSNTEFMKPAADQQEREQRSAAAGSSRARRTGGESVQESDAIAPSGMSGFGAGEAMFGAASRAARAPAPASPAPGASAASGPVAQGQAASGLAQRNHSLERSTDQPSQENQNYGSLAAGGAAGTPQPPPAAEPLSQSLDSAKSLRADQRYFAPEQEAAAAPAATPAPAAQIVAARSDAWSQDEVDAAMNRVWYFVAPGAAAGGSVSQQGMPQLAAPQQVSGGMMGTYDYADPAGQAGAAPSPSLAYGAQPANGKAIAEGDLDLKANALSKAISNAPAARSEGAADDANARQGAPTLSAGAPVVGLARLPPGQTASDWLQRLERERSLQPLQPLFESESLAAKLSERDTADKAGKKDKPPAAQTVVLFVTASEARQILQSLDTENKEAAQAKQQGQQESSDRFEAALATPQAGDVALEELPAWWTRPQARFKQSANESKTRGDEKVILILSQLPRG